MTLLNLIGNLASIAGLAITLLLFRKIKNIQREFLLTARLPELVNQLISNNNTLQELLAKSKESTKGAPYSLAKYVDDSVEVLMNATLETCKSNLINLSSKLQGETKTAATDLVTRIGRLTKGALEHLDITDIHARLTGVITQVENELQDKKWTKQT
jgi:hypothetical protein